MKREVAQLLEDICELEKMGEAEKRRYCGLREDISSVGGITINFKNMRYINDRE